MRKKLPDARLEVRIASGYCPSKECMNYRPDEISFQSRFQSGVVRYENNSGCKLTVTFDEKSANVRQTDLCSDDEHSYLHASGAYKFLKSEVNDEDCGP